MLNFSIFILIQKASQLKLIIFIILQIEFYAIITKEFYKKLGSFLTVKIQFMCWVCR